MAFVCSKISDVVNGKRSEYGVKTYEESCRDDPVMQSFDASIQSRTARVINTVVSGVDVRSLSFDCLKEITGGLLEMNQEVVCIILDYQKDIWKNKELFQLVEEYFDNSLHMLDFCNALERCLMTAGERQMMIRVMLSRFEEEDVCAEASVFQPNEAKREEKYEKTLKELKRFKEAEDPFTEDFFKILAKVEEKQRSMLSNLRLRHGRISRRLKSLKVWRRLSGIIFVAAVVAVVICSVVAAAVAAPPIAAALASAVSVPLGSVGKWFDSLWKRYQATAEREVELLESVQVRTIVAIWDLGSIKALVDNLDMQIESMVKNADFSLRGEEAVKLGIDEIRKRMEEFTKNLDELNQHASNCRHHIINGRRAILQKIMKHQN